MDMWIGVCAELCTNMCTDGADMCVHMDGDACRDACRVLDMCIDKIVSVVPVLRVTDTRQTCIYKCLFTPRGSAQRVAAGFL